MTRNRILGLFTGVSLLCALPIRGQEPRPASERTGSSSRELAAEPNSIAIDGSISREAQAAAPRVLKFSGVLLDASGKPLSGEVEATFALYKQEGDEEPLWTETQRVTADEHGGYTALLGVTQATGVPAELFRSDEARWLGVQVQGQTQQPRTLLVSVPYALKAVEAEKLAGKSASDFVLSESLGDQVRRVIEGQTIIASQATSNAASQPAQPKASSTSSSPTGAAGPMFPPSSFSGTNATQIVSVQQNGAGIGLYSSSAGLNGTGVLGQASNTAGNATGVIGVTNSLTGSGVFGKSSSTGGTGVFGDATATSGFTRGITGQTVSPDGIGVNGVNNSASGFATGVSGFTASTNGVAVFANAVATSGSATGMLGVTNSPGGAGVVGATNATSVGANGVYGQSANPGGNGVFGNALATSGFANGVFGQTASPGGAGVVGNATATSGFVNGVQGQSASTGGSGVAGNTIATSGFVSGVSGDASPSPNGTGVFGSSFQWVGVGGQATAPSGGPAYGVWGDSRSTEGSGVAGFADATSGHTTGVFGQTSSPDGNGIMGVSNSSYANFNDGVVGINNSTSGNAYGVNGSTQTIGFGAGVAGAAFATTGTAFGVFGQAHSPNGTAVFGTAASTSGFPTAVVGFLDSPQGGVAGQFVAHTGAGLILQGLSGPNFNQVFSVDANGNLNVSGNLVVSGTKSSTAKLQNGREVALYAVESPENWFEDFGSAELKSGVAWVPLDASFAEATNAAVMYHVFLTPNGDSNGLYVARKTATGFEVREHGGGGSNVAFDYRIVIRRRGYEAIRMAEVQRDAKTADASRQHLGEFVSSGMPKRTAALKAPQIVTPPVIQRATQRPDVPQPPKPVIPQVPRVNVPQAPKANVTQPPQPR
ncbi:MAG TPA: hypothetical protein VHM93_08440 [Candidatus Acidoferrum sp.]|nr:hypothetical protein [Candidatus Acidoferrum sp.]